jgi:carbon monoxide dehydrogenase subunit G
MVTVEKTIVINRSQQEVFDFASNPANAPKWQSVIISKSWTSEDPPGVGSKQHVVARWLGREIETTNEFTIWEPPDQNRFKTSSGPFRLEEGMRFEPQGNSTRLTWDMQVEGRGIFKLVEGLLKNQAEKTAVTDLEALKLIVESGLESATRP